MRLQLVTNPRIWVPYFMNLTPISTSPLPERAQLFLKWTREIAIDHRPNMAAFIILAWDSDGNITICGDIASDNNQPIPRYLLPAWVAEHIRAEFVTTSEVKQVLRDIGILAPPNPSA